MQCKLSTKSYKNKTLFYLNFSNVKVWISNRLIEKAEKEIGYIRFPKRNAKIVATIEGIYILQYKENWNTFLFLMGDIDTVEMSFNILEDNVNILKVNYILYSLVGKDIIGRDIGAIISTKKNTVKVHYKKHSPYHQSENVFEILTI